MQLLSGVPFQELGMPLLPDKAFVSISETIQHTLYKGMIAPAVLFGCLLFLVRRVTSKEAALQDHHVDDPKGEE